MNMKKLILISVVVHVILIAVLAPLVKTRMEFDEQKEAQRTEEVKAREAERKEQDRVRREKQKLDEKTAKMLKREAEFRKREEIKQQVTELRKKRDVMMERRDRELDKFRKREQKDSLAREKIKLDRIAKNIIKHVSEANELATHKDTVFARYPNENKGAMHGFLDDIKVTKRIWSDGEITNEATAPVASDYLWDFENGNKETLGGREFELEQNAKIVSREDGGGLALDATDFKALVRVGPVEYGSAFTIAASVRLESGGEEEQIILTNKHTGNHTRAIRLLVTGKEGEGKVVFRTTGKNEGESNSATKPGSFPFGKWTRVVVTTDIEAAKVRIFIDGVEMELPEADLAEDVITAASDLRDLKAETNKALDKLTDVAIDPAKISEMIKELDNLSDRIDEKMEEEKEDNHIGNELAEANKDIQEAKDILANLDSKLDMDKMNNTDAAMADQVQPPAPANANTAPASEMYKEAEALEKQIAAAMADVNAAGEAVSQNTSYAEARDKASATTPSRPDLTSALSGAAPGTVGELNEFRENLNRAENEMQDMNARADLALGISVQKSLTASSFASGAAMSSAASMTGSFGMVVDMTGFGPPQGGVRSIGMRTDESGEGSTMTYSTNLQALKLDEGKIIKAAMPGRRFTEASIRKGWLYLDTWYVIGPWENNSNVDYTVKHQPEFGIDFDAKYYDGKFAQTPGHPYETLKWEFYQSDQVRSQPLIAYGAATYYAYTDVWFEEARDMLIAVASDDASSVWLNGQIIWQDTGQSAWSLGEGFRKVHFNKGYNDVLVRIENGPGHCIWSVVLCPPEMLNK